MPSRTRPAAPPLLALLTGGVLALAACGSGTSTATSSGGPVQDTEQTVGAVATAPAADATAAASDAASAAGLPVSIDHVYGSTTVETAPERVVTVGFSDQDTVLALGVVPVGIRDWYGDQPDATWPWAQDELGDAEPTVLSSAELDFEAVAALAPDLIVGQSSGMTQEEYDLLSRIAPTLPQSGDYPTYGMPWQEQTRTLGAALGRSGEAESVVTETEQLFTDAREANPGLSGATAAVSFLFDGQPGAYASVDSRSRVLTDLGLSIPASFDEAAGDAFFFSVSPEEVGRLDADVVVWIVGSDAEAQAIADLPTRGAMTAVAEGREVLTDFELSGAFSFASPLSLPYVVQELVPELVLAVDGDPATEVPSAAVLRD